MTQEEWGRWIEHDGRGCPVLDDTDYLHCVTNFGQEFYGYFGSMAEQIVEVYESEFIVRYRIRKPRGLTILQRIAERPRKEKVQA